MGGQVTIPDEVKLRLKEMGHYDVIPLGKIMGMGEEGHENTPADRQSLILKEVGKI